MNWLGLVLVVLGAYLAYKLVGALLKLLMFALVLVGAYWFAAPHLGWPTVSELFYVLGPDFGGRRIEEVMRPSSIAGEVADRVVDGVVERIVPASSSVAEPLGGEFPEPLPAQLPEPLPEPTSEMPPGAEVAGGVDAGQARPGTAPRAR